MKKSIPLSQVQYGIYAECVGHADEPCYNLPYLYILDGSLDGDRLRAAIKTAVCAHPTLFTRIELNADGEPMQVIAEDEDFDVVIEDVEDIEALKPSLTVPFNIYGDRLFHIRLMRDNEHYYFFLDIHHIIADGTSLKVLLDDVDAAYLGKTLAPEALTMAEMVAEESQLRQSPAFDEDKQWYASHFDCGDTFTQLMPDLDLAEHAEASMLRTLSVEASRVDAFCKENGIFRSNFFTMAYAFLLARYNNEQESLFTTVYHGRTDKRFNHSIGMTVRTLPVYSKFTTDTTVLDYLRAGQEQMSGCREHSAYAYSDLMNDLKLQVNTMFAWHAMIFSNTQMGGKPMRAVRIGNSTLEASLYLKAFILNGKYQVKAEYHSNEYSEALIAQFLESYEAVVEGFLTKDLLCDIDIATSQQVAVLDSFNNTDVPYDATQTIISLFRRQAKATPDHVALVFKDTRYTYREVDELSDRIAAYIENHTEGGGVVSVLIPRCEWMAISSLGVLKAGCAYQPLDPTYPKERLNFMMKDADAKLLIADEQLRGIVDEYDGQVLLTKDIQHLPLSQSAPTATVSPDSPFILLYTSGSTGVPKGCRLTHANLVAFCHWYQRYYDLKPEHCVAAYASYGFDACMMDMYPALTCGAAVHIIPEEIRLDLVALNDYFERQHITHSFMTTQVGYQFASNIDNHSLKCLSTGGEKLASLTPPKGYRFFNGYGPTECTIFTTTFLVDKKLKDIPIGRPLDNMRLYIVDPQGRRLPVGAAGELWVSGPQVSSGYLNRPDKTAEVFIENPFTNVEKYRRVYRTGDIVRYLPDGNIQFVGRRDGQVKIRGFRIELKEVEAVIRDFPGIKDATVQAFDADGGNGKFIAAYVVSEQQVDIQALNDFILEQKPPYMVPAVTMQIDSIPLNQNQKVNKRALPKPVRSVVEVTPETSNAPLNILEEELHALIASVIGTDNFATTTLLSYAGMDSISAIRLAVLVSKRYHVELDSRALIKSGTLQSIENVILQHLLSDQTNSKNDDSSVPTKPVRTSVPLSYAQTGVYLECLKNPASTIYNIPYLLTFPSGTEASQLARAVRSVVESHPELGIHLQTEGDVIMQTTADSVPVEVPVTEMTDAKLSEYKRDFVRPFNLKKAPLYRFEVVKTEQAVHLLMDVHHLIFDGGSADLLIRQLCSVLEGETAHSESYTYFDFVTDQQQREDSDTFRASQAFFAEKLGTCEGASEIPADLSPSRDGDGENQGFIGETVCPTDLQKATAFCRQLQVTPAHLYLAAVSYVVSRYTNNRDVYLCTVSSGRSNLKIADTVGMFVNTLALGVSIDDVSVEEFLRRVATTFNDTLQHEDYPFARIATDYGFRPAIAYAYQVGVLQQYAVSGQAVGQELLELNVPKFKINIKIEERGVVVQYDDSLYSQRLANAMAESIVAVAERMVAAPEAKVRQVSIVSERQEQELAQLRSASPSASDAPFSPNAPFKYFHDCIAHFAQTQPEHEALVACDARFTYQEMDEATNRMAAALQRHGVQPGDRVALLLPRTSRLILAMFGVMKAGAAYIPCDPDYPADRVKLILEDSEARYVITTSSTLHDSSMGEDSGYTLPREKMLDVEDLLSSDVVAPLSNGDLGADALAYLIYTSGSTGRPKGVMLRHEGICNYLYGHPANVFAHAVLTDAERILSVTTISFDAALQDIGMALFNGKTLILATEAQVNNPSELSRLIAEQHIDMVSGTPSRWNTWLTSPTFCDAISSVKICRAGGEKFSQQLLQQMRQCTKARIFNCYGPTEITVASNNAELTHVTQVTVGKPQLNVKEFIVDGDGNELPVGVVGELYIGGRGVARGYNNLDEMTRERFVEYHGSRVYRSGDYARWLPDGNVAILGRTDHQIKLRGLRIELGEIENVMLKVEGMKKVVILIRKLGGKEHLCAYYTADREIATDMLKAEISKHLTQYMVPTAYLQLKEMPMTPNGKTDVKALPEPLLATGGVYEAPANDTEKAFCDIFATVLQMDRVSVTDDFFQLGGTSLVVMQVIIEAEKVGMRVAYADVFAHPTPRQLAALITGDSSVPSGSAVGDDSVTSFDYTAIDNLLRDNTLEAFRSGQRQALGSVLVTGATGYLGIHILRELIDSDAPHICCLVRGKTVEKARRRLQTMLFYYFDNAFNDVFEAGRLTVVTGDVTSFGDDNLPHIDTVFNCAAIVKHFSEGTEIEDVNIGGARHCVEFCLRTGARLVHISTASTRGLWVEGSAPTPVHEVFTEQRLYMGQYLGNKYIYSKFMAERLILEAVAQQGLDAKIMRVGNLAARSTDGEFQANFSTNSFMGRIKVYHMLGCCPYSMRNKRVEFSPINEVSTAIVLLATTPKACTVFHPYNIHTQFLGDVLTGLSTIGDGVRFVEREDFERAMEQAKDDAQKAQQLASLLAYQDMAHGQATSDVSRDNDYTMQVLYRLGFAWSPTSWDYVGRMLTAIGGLGFFE